MVQNGYLFHGLRSEDPNQHLKDFLKLVDSLDLDGENRERTRLRLFQFSLCNQASNWLERLPAGSITTWEDLTTRFLAQFFPPGRTTKLRNDILMFQQHHGESLSEAWTHFKDLLQKVPHHGIDLWLQVQIFYNHVNPVTRRTIDQSAGGKLCDQNTEESWALLEDLDLYDNESWNDPRDFAKPVKAIALPQDPTQVNKLTTLCEICSGPHDTQYCMDDSEQAYVDYSSSCTNEIGGKRFTLNQGPRNFNDAANTLKEKPNFNRARSQTFTIPQNGSISTHSSSYQMKLEKALLDFDSNQEKRLSHLRTQLGQQQDDMIGKINLLWKTISKKLIDVSTPRKCRKLHGPQEHCSNHSCQKGGTNKERNQKPVEVDSDTEENVSSTNACGHDLGKITRGNEEVKKQGREEDEMETDMEVEELIEEKESKSETDEEVEEILEEEEEDENDENFNSFPTVKELSHHEWLLKNPRTPLDEGDMRGVRHLMRLEKEMMDDKGEVTLYLMRRSLEVLRKFYWMILVGQFNQLLHVSSPLLSKPGEC
ncbi:MAK10-like protein [Tanacetum coccineum]